VCCLFQSLLEVKHLKLETSQLLLASCVLLLDRNEPLYQIVFGLLQVALTNSLGVTIWSNARGLRRDMDLTLAPLLSSTASVGHAMFAVVRVGFRIAKNSCFLDALAFWIQFA